MRHTGIWKSARIDQAGRMVSGEPDKKGGRAPRKAATKCRWLPGLAAVAALATVSALVVGCRSRSARPQPADASLDARSSGPLGPPTSVRPTITGKLCRADLGLCTSEGWCWQFPLPQGAALYAASGMRSGDVFAAGSGGTILRNTAGKWSIVESQTDEDLYGLWVNGATDAFAVGDRGTILHFDGRRWSSMPSGTTKVLNGVWGSGPSDVFAVGGGRKSGQENGVILHYDGRRWIQAAKGTSLPSLDAIWGAGPSDVFAAGAGRSGWESVRGAAVHFDGSSWRAISFPNERQGVWGLWGTTSRLFGVGYREGGVAAYTHGDVLLYDGSWKRMFGNPDLLEAVWGSSGSDVFAVGRRGRIVHSDGTTWTTQRSIPTSTTGVQASSGSWLAGVWGASSSDVYAVGDHGQILHYDGHSWKTLRELFGPGGRIKGIWSSGPKDVYAVSDMGGVFHFDGSCWTRYELPGRPRLTALAGLGRGRILAVGLESSSPYRGLLFRLEAGRWTRQNFRRVWFTGLWASSATDIFAIGSEPDQNPSRSSSGYPIERVWRFDGRAWRPMAGLTADLEAIWGNSPSDLYVGGTTSSTQGRAVWRFDGAKWRRMGIDASCRFCRVTALWSSGPDDVFAADASFGVYHFDGRRWTRQVLRSGMEGYSADISLWGSSPSNVYAVGEHFGVSRYDGGAWKRMDPGGAYPSAVGGSGARDVWIGGWGWIAGRRR